VSGPRHHDEGRPRLLKAPAAARYLGVPYTTFRDWVHRGYVPLVQPPGCRSWWFDRADLDGFVERYKEIEESVADRAVPRMRAVR
jgi:excisionase family DNA binding protein